MKNNWQLNVPIDAIVFDCDSTLSHIEGIDELANTRAVGALVADLTERAMNETGVNVELYAKRLDLVKPHQTQVKELGEQYYAQRAPDIEAVLDVLRAAGKAIYIISAGVNPAVALFGGRLGIKQNTIYAVDLTFNTDGEYVDFSRQSPLVNRNGKRLIIQELKKRHSRIVHVGDGLNDVEAMDLVTRFIGYGGACYREKIANLCDFYIYSPSLLPILPLTLTTDEIKQLSNTQRTYCDSGLDLIAAQQVKLS